MVPIIERDSILIEVWGPEGYDIKRTEFTKNPEGLIRIFDQYALETFKGESFVPVGKYLVSRTKWWFRPAVYKVRVVASSR